MKLQTRQVITKPTGINSSCWTEYTSSHILLLAELTKHAHVRFCICIVSNNSLQLKMLCEGTPPIPFCSQYAAQRIFFTLRFIQHIIYTNLHDTMVFNYTYCTVCNKFITQANCNWRYGGLTLNIEYDLVIIRFFSLDYHSSLHHTHTYIP